MQLYVGRAANTRPRKGEYARQRQYPAPLRKVPDPTSRDVGSLPLESRHVGKRHAGGI